MANEWIIGSQGRNLKFKHETLLNYGMNHWGLNKAASVDTTSKLIRDCSPRSFDEWEQYYFNNAIQKKRNGIKITKDYITELGQRLYIKLSEVVHKELESITEEECIDYAYNLVLNRTYEGYIGEIKTIYERLEKLLDIKIEAAPDDWDRLYNIDFFIKINEKYIGLQIKPTTFKHSFDSFKWKDIQTTSHSKFQQKFGGKVFTIFSGKADNKKTIINPEVVDEIKMEIARLKKEF